MHKLIFILSIFIGTGSYADDTFEGGVFEIAKGHIITVGHNHNLEKRFVFEDTGQTMEFYNCTQGGYITNQKDILINNRTIEASIKRNKSVQLTYYTYGSKACIVRVAILR